MAKTVYLLSSAPSTTLHYAVPSTVTAVRPLLGSNTHTVVVPAQRTAVMHSVSWIAIWLCAWGEVDLDAEVGFGPFEANR